MRDETIWHPLREMLKQFSDRGRTADLWLRDDDAVKPTAPLEQLLRLTEENGIPLSLAVIPEFTGEALADRLSSQALTSVTVHGWSHRNHAPPERKKQELGPDRPAEIVLGELRKGFGKLRSLYQRQFIPVLVPPWNRIDTSLLPALPALGFKGASVFGKAKSGMPLKLINTHVDLMDWHGTAGCLPHRDLVAMLVAELSDRLEGSDEPVGVLAHHLVHDASAWDFLARLFEETRSPALRWRSLGDLLDQNSMT